jgi:putative spermidine/putrescine transport system ATP-binding protein
VTNHTHELVLDSLVRTYGSTTAVNRVSLAVRRGEFVTLLGPSGSGKTTTLMMVAGFVTPTAGSVHFRGENITYKPAHLRNVGMVFQNYALFPHMTVLENVAFPLRMRKVPAAQIRERVAAALDLVRMPDHEQRMPAQLSGGQQQRIALARALVFEPALLLMDEPLGALDKNLRERMQLEFKAVQQATGVTIVYVTHDQQEALVLSDRVVVMEGGCIRMEGSASDVYERPVDPFVAQFVGETNWLRGRVFETAGGGRAARLGPSLAVPLPDATQAVGAEVSFFVRPERIDVSPREPRAATSTGLAFDARVADVTYLGDVIKYRVVLLGSEPEMSVTAKVLAHGRSPRLRIGEGVLVSWQPEDAWVPPDGHS